MSTENGHRTPGPAAVARVWPAVLLRYRSGTIGHTARVVHLVLLVCESQAASAVVVFCGALLRRDLVEAVRSGQGTLCALCVINHCNTSSPPPADTLAMQATKILHRWRCRSLTLIHPDAPEHRVVLAGQRHSVAPPYPRSVHRTTGTLPLPPTVTPCGPLTWVRPPRANALSLCGEFEVFAALRTALRDPPVGRAARPTAAQKRPVRLGCFCTGLSAACGPSGCRCGPVRES